MGDEELHCYTSNSQYTARLGQYHAPQVDALKQELSCIFKSPNSHVRLLLAPEAYSMGTDAPDIRRVIHIGPPSTLETYLQETGRAGRDGEHAEAIMYMNKSDIASNVKHLSKEMKDFCTTSKCRRQTLMNYFEFECVQPEPGHRCCDNCSKTCQCAECIIHKVFETDFHLSTQESNEQIPAPRKAAVKMASQLLTDYFEAENQVADVPFSNLQTGLDKKLASKISADYNRFSNVDILKSEFKDIDLAYLDNIACLLKYVVQHYHSP
ncbi:putative ATP-dependent DNA helicase Q1 [Haliotis rubra]|uniref:putative ATP-dependent DNA helicase Q1 n=1 Tax=Haliotis rubra TaxID=36100 RepID=UPI001EE5D3E0|nr:putative ATP-dependent DNA helicase Q1 [Haliotis rubra]